MPNWAVLITFVLDSASYFLYQQYYSNSQADRTSLQPTYSLQFHVNVKWLDNEDIEIVVRWAIGVYKNNSIILNNEDISERLVFFPYR